VQYVHINQESSIMGNRAVVCFTDTNKSPAVYAPAVYVHWNGGRASVEGYLRAARLLHLDPDMAEFHRLVEGYLGSSAHLQTVGTSDCDNGDNGQYMVSPEWEIVSRKHTRRGEEIDAAKTREIAIDCIAAYQVWS